MRIVGGRFRGRALAAPTGLLTRPTSDRVRESLFNILAHGIEGLEIEGARVLDLFAGTGALGIEALSRGAAYCLFVEDNADARGIIRENIEALGLTGASKVWRRDATNSEPPRRCSPSSSCSRTRPTARAGRTGAEGRGRWRLAFGRGGLRA